MPDPASPACLELPKEIERAIESVVFSSYSHGLGVGDGTLDQMEPRRSAEAREALTAAILSRLGEAEARADRFEAAVRTAQSALSMLTEPQAIRSTRVQEAWAIAVEAELKCRLAIKEV